LRQVSALSLSACAVTRLEIKEQADAEGTIRGRTFEDCDLLGPAILVPIGSGNTVTDCVYEAFPLRTYYSRTPSTPVFLVIECTFRRCTFATDVDAAELLASQ
jgi:hypothetical protein